MKRIVRLRSGGQIEIESSGLNVFALGPAERTLVGGVTDLIAAYEGSSLEALQAGNEARLQRITKELADLDEGPIVDNPKP